MSASSGEIENDKIVWSAISLTYVEYPKGDKLGYVLAWSSLTPIFLAIAFIALILFRRDLHTISYFAGLLVNETINWTLKHSIKQFRPILRNEHILTEYGMPSSHAQFMSFFTVYLLLFLYIRLHHQNKMVYSLWKHGVAFASICITICVAYSRVYLMYHSAEQVYYGLLAGTLFASVWFCVVHNVLSPLFPVIASWTISQYLMVRDSSLIPNVLWFEYCAHRDEVRNRQRKLSKKTQ